MPEYAVGQTTGKADLRLDGDATQSSAPETDYIRLGNIDPGSSRASGREGDGR
ncbi:hypothetical protein M6B38_330200 [Iris pallida]|uniref:Uncharacterized protein n=1 Tax=Iris pallida TaxID=29817 RepID=A0AAX6H428_IRIPA|nr:hypothetical protein M6B38_128535 [Iris pallida]KAJ6835780.1 hypothetical protein M6B38_330200 [Iris pallida]